MIDRHASWTIDEQAQDPCRPFAHPLDFHELVSLPADDGLEQAASLLGHGL
jgi:hypothetical protein